VGRHRRRATNWPRWRDGAFGTQVDFTASALEGIGAVTIEDITPSGRYGLRIKLLGVAADTVLSVWNSACRLPLLPATSPLAQLKAAPIGRAGKAMRGPNRAARPQVGGRRSNRQRHHGPTSWIWRAGTRYVTLPPAQHWPPRACGNRAIPAPYSPRCSCWINRRRCQGGRCRWRPRCPARPDAPV